MLTQPLDHAPDTVREQARHLLSHPPYREDPEGPLTRLMAVIREWLAGFLDRVLGSIAADTTLAWMVVAVGVVVLALVVWRTTRGMSTDRRIETAVAGGTGGRTAAEWLAEADEHEVAARWAQAVRCRYVAIVTSLIEAGVIEEVPGRTVGELDRELAATAPGMAAHVAEAGGLFAAVIYGRRTAGAQHAERMDALVREVVGTRRGGTLVGSSR